MVKKVLIIDPDHNERTVMASFLKGGNYQIETANNLTSAIIKLSNENFDCLVLDVDLPEMKGYEAVSVLKRLNPEVKVIMTSKTNNRELESKVREQDIFYYFIKTFKKEELKLAINNVFNKKEYDNGKCQS